MPVKRQAAKSSGVSLMATTRNEARQYANHHLFGQAYELGQDQRTLRTLNTQSHHAQRTGTSKQTIRPARSRLLAITGAVACF